MLASGSADGVVGVWDLRRRNITTEAAIAIKQLQETHKKMIEENKAQEKTA